MADYKYEGEQRRSTKPPFAIDGRGEVRPG